MSIPEITVQELASLRQSNQDYLILDVRNPDEYAICNINGHLIPFNELPARLKELNPEQKIIVHCRGGGRSSRAVQLMQQHGFNNVYNLRGGIMAWATEIDPSMTKY